MARYSMGENGVVLRDDGASIPPAIENRDYREFLEWVAAGNTPDPYVPPPTLPVTIFDGATFLSRVTDDEYAAITASSNVQVRRWLDIFRLRGEIDVTGETALRAKAGLVALGLLTAERAEVIFATG